MVWTTSLGWQRQLPHTAFTWDTDDTPAACLLCSPGTIRHANSVENGPPPSGVEGQTARTRFAMGVVSSISTKNRCAVGLQLVTRAQHQEEQMYACISRNMSVIKLATSTG